MDDSALLRQYIENDSDEAFAALVTRHINLVYSVALRHVGNPHHAEEITQAVFIILAKKVRELRHDKALSSWLFHATHLTANNFVRSEMRRQTREQEAHMQSVLNESGTNIWMRISPLLDTAVAGLNEKDRRTIVLRFYEGRNLREVGVALGASEEAAKKRVARALEKLRKFFLKRGVASTTVMIAGVISANSVQAAPAALATSISSIAAAKGAAISGSTLTLIKGALKVMAWTKTKTALAVCGGVLLFAATAGIAVKEVEAHRGEVWQRKYDALILDRMPPQTKIVPLLRSRPAGVDVWGGRNGKWIGLGVTSTSIVQAAYDASLGRMIFSVPAPEGRYDFVSSLSNGSQQALQQEVKRKFGLVGRRTLVETNVLALTLRNRNVPGLNPNSDPAGQNSSRTSDSIQCVYVPISKLVEFLENALGTPVVDRTGLTGYFDIYVKWDSTTEGLKRAVPEQLGLELVPGREPIEFLVIEKRN